MDVLVAGGTGFIGSRVVDELLASGRHHIRVMTRDPSRAPKKPDVEYVRGDVTEPASLQAATRGIETIVHAVQFPNHPVENPRKGWTYQAIDGAGTERMVAAATQNGVRRFVYLSGAGVRPGRSEPWFKAKERAEEAIRASGMEYVILRPSWIYGPDDRSMNKFVQFVKVLPVVPVIGSGQAQVNPVSVFDVAKVAAAAVDEPAATNRIFELGSREPVTMDEVLRTIMRVLGKRRPLLHQPAWLVKIPASLLQYLPNPPLSPGAVDFISMNEPVDPGEAERVFGVHFTPLEEGLRAYLRPRTAG
ncbi:MAG: NAD(P)H-binding protein [Chloroflexi bacterium]|nr:NAD(P)H-binding protein [Chloroflexota bacterium]